MSIISTFRDLMTRPAPKRSLEPVLVDLRNLEIAEKAQPEQKYGAGKENEASAFWWITNLSQRSDGLAAWGTVLRDQQLRTIWTEEPILAGAMASMTMKMVSLGWKVTGPKNKARRMSRVLAEANDGAGWSDYIAKYAQDFLSQDKGAFTEIGHTSRDLDGPVAAIWNIDSNNMLLRNNPNFPFWFTGDGKFVRVPRNAAFRTASMPSPNVSFAGMGFCAVSRAIKAARLLIALHEYDADKLSNMPPQGIAAISGLTERQMNDALTKYKMSLERKDLIYPGVLWLASMTGKLEVNMTPFSTLPDAFSRQEIVPLYVYTLALDFGVDAREFWPAAVAGATRADALVQAMKAKGKGPGELISVTERGMNTYIMPEEVVFGFDFTDDDEDALKADIDKTRVETVMEMYSKSYQMTEGNPIITQQEAREILARWGILPREVLSQPEEIVGDTGGFRSAPADIRDKVVIEYRNGVLEESDFTKRWYIFGTGTGNVNGHKAATVKELEEAKIL